MNILFCIMLTITSYSIYPAMREAHPKSAKSTAGNLTLENALAIARRRHDHAIKLDNYDDVRGYIVGLTARVRGHLDHPDIQEIMNALKDRCKSLRKAHITQAARIEYDLIVNQAKKYACILQQKLDPHKIGKCYIMLLDKIMCFNNEFAKYQIKIPEIRSMLQNSERLIEELMILQQVHSERV